MRRRYDAVVVGSGFGGGVAACRLAENGWNVCVLERGRRFTQFDEPSPVGAAKLLWHRWLNPGGMLDLRSYRDLWVVCAAGVGGGSLAYANVLLRAEPDLFDNGWPTDVDRTELDPYYQRVCDMLEPNPVPDPAPPRTRAIEELARLAGLPFERAPIAVYFGDGRTNRFGRRQEGCDYNALCDVGCPMHSKNSIDLTYLARAEAAGAEVHPQREVLDLEPPARAGGAWRVGFRKLGPRHPFGSKDWVEAPVVILAAGSIGSTRILLNNARGLKGLSPSLGSRFGGNGDALAVAFDPQRPGVSDPLSPEAPVITSLMNLWKCDRYIIEDGALPQGLIGLLDLVYTLGRLRNPKIPLVLLKRLATYLGFSDVSLTRRSASRRQLKAQLTDFNGHDIRTALVFLMIGDEQPNKRMKLTRLRRLDIRQEHKSPMNDLLFDEMRKRAEGLAETADAADKWLPIGDFGPLGKFITVHPLGGCPMADTPQKGVVNSFGAVYGYEGQGLFVLDGSILPGAAGVNPAMTIAALAERGVDHLLATGPSRSGGAQNGLAGSASLA